MPKKDSFFFIVIPEKKRKWQKELSSIGGTVPFDWRNKDSVRP